MSLLHVTFKDPPPRVMIGGVSTPVIAVTAELDMTHDECAKPTAVRGVRLRTRTLVVVGRAPGPELVKMRTTLIVAEDHIASSVACEAQ